MDSGAIALAWFDQLDSRTRDLGRIGQLRVLAYAAIDAALSAYRDNGEGGMRAGVVRIRNTFIRTTGAARTAESGLFEHELAVRNERNRFGVDTTASGRAAMTVASPMLSSPPEFVRRLQCSLKVYDLNADEDGD